MAAAGRRADTGVMTTPGSQGAPAGYGMASAGSPLYAATIGVADLTQSLRFYESTLGLDVLDRRRMAGAEFTRHWGLPAGVTADVAVLADRDCPVGRVALLEFGVPGRERVRNVEGQCIFGFVNLNFYTEDIHAHVPRLVAAGCRPWSDPVLHDMGPAIGTPVEIMLDGPDSVIINMIELRAPNPEARILLTMAYIADHGGYNRCGASPVVTTQHCVRDYDAAMAFNTRVMGMSVRNNTILKGADMERFMRYPPGAQTRDTYLQGNHVFGKVAINHPLNFPCVDIVPRAVAPNIGYLAQTFIVPDLAASLGAARELGAEVFSSPLELDMPALGRVATAILRNPGSGALHELVQRL
jgi:catechol 2,3-dioxygenase-like lactoylglutathione lyase family enzyme